MDYHGLLVEVAHGSEVLLEEGIEDDLVDVGQVGCGAGGWAREVGGGDAEAGEEEVGLLVVDVVGGDSSVGDIGTKDKSKGQYGGSSLRSE